MLSSSIRQIPRRVHPKCRSTTRSITVSQSSHFAHDVEQQPLPPPKSNLRVRPWKTNPDTSYTKKLKGGTEIENYHSRLEYAVSSSQPNRCFAIAAEMKSNNVRPDLKTYNLILQCLADSVSGNEAYAVMDDMVLSGIEPDSTSYTLLLVVGVVLSRVCPPLTWTGRQTHTETHPTIGQSCKPWRRRESSPARLHTPYYFGSSHMLGISKCA